MSRAASRCLRDVLRRSALDSQDWRRFPLLQVNPRPPFGQITITTIAQSAGDLAALEKRQQMALEKQFQELSRTIEQTARDLTKDIEALSRDQAQDVAQLHERLETIEKRIEQVGTRVEAAQITALGYQKRADKQESRLEELWKLLQAEIAARQVLEQQSSRTFLPAREQPETFSGPGRGGAAMNDLESYPAAADHPYPARYAGQ